MSFYYPLGLLGLIGIPVIVFIYIIKSKYTEQTVSSTYLWELSEKFLKRRKPISKLTGIVSLLLQLFAVLIVSVSIAHPVFTVPDSANDVYIILDGSASMNMQAGGVTRFAAAQKRVNRIIDKAREGSSYSLVLVGDTAQVVFEGVTDKEQAKVFVSALSAGWTASDCASAMTMAQEYFDANRSAVMYLVTDKPYEVNDALTLIDVSGGENNIAFADYDYEPADGGLCGTGHVISYARDEVVTVEMWIADERQGAAERVAQTQVLAVKGQPTPFSLPSSHTQFARLELRIAASDAMAEDNLVVMYDREKAQVRRVLLVRNAEDIKDETDDSAYLRFAMATSGKAEVDVTDSETYAAQGAQGYGMYVFNGYTPDELPQNASVWLIDAIDGADEKTGVSYRDHFTPRDQEGPGSYVVPEYTRDTTALAAMLTKDLVRRPIAVRTYAQYSAARTFTPVLTVNGEDHIVFAGLNKNSDRQVVFGFRIKDSDFGFRDDFLILVHNLMEYSFPSVLGQTDYVCGDTMAVNVVPGCEGIVLTSPSGKSTTLDTIGNDVCEVALHETGTYTLAVKRQGSNDTEIVSAFASVPESESRSDAGGAMLLSGEREFAYSDGFYDKLIVFFIAIAVLLLADWGVYCYEQYQLR